MEAKVYTVLVPVQKMGGYQIASQLGVARPSVYSALESLSSKGYVTAIHGEKTEYTAVKPAVLFKRLSREYEKNAREAENALKKLVPVPGGQERFANIEGKSNIIAAANSLIQNAKKEIVFTCSMSLECFETELKKASERGVRIILFSWSNLDTLGLNLEFYSGYDGQELCAESRILLVTDASHCLIGSNDRITLYRHAGILEKLPDGEKDFLGMSSDNRLMVNLVMEHIHFDIYLQRLKKAHGKNLIDSAIQIGSLMERGDL